jgi:hypothetical protein
VPENHYVPFHPSGFTGHPSGFARPQFPPKAVQTSDKGRCNAEFFDMRRFDCHESPTDVILFNALLENVLHIRFGEPVKILIRSALL